MPKRGIGATTLARLNDYAAAQNASLFEIVTNASQVPGITARTAAKLEQFSTLLFELMGEVDQVPMEVLIADVIHKTGYLDELLAEPTTKVVLTRGGLVAVPRGQGELVDYENVKMRLATLPGAYVSAELARYPEAVAMFLGSYVGARGESVVAVDITRVPETGVPGVGGIAGVSGAAGGVLGTQDSGTVDGALGKNGISGGAAAGIRQPGNAKGNGGVAAAKIAGPLGVPDSAGQGADDAFDDSVGAPVQPLAPKPTLLQQAVTRFDWVDLRGFAPHSNAR